MDGKSPNRQFRIRCICPRKNEKGKYSELRNLPFVTYEDTIQTSKGNAYWISCKLFDTIPVKKIKVQTVEEDKVSVCGQPVGLYMETKGVLIIDTGEIVQADGMTCTPAKNIAKSGDYILKVNGETIQTKKGADCIKYKIQREKK